MKNQFSSGETGNSSITIHSERRFKLAQLWTDIEDDKYEIQAPGIFWNVSINHSSKYFDLRKSLFKYFEDTILSVLLVISFEAML